MPKLAVTVVRPSGADSGNIATLIVRGARVWGAGGSNYRPTCVYSHDGGRSFVTWSTPPTWGLRGVFEEDDRVWVAGEHGMVAYTSAGDGEEWERVAIGPVANCLYTIKRCAKGLLTVMGDDGTVVHSRTGKRWRQVQTRSTGRIFDLYGDGATNWLVDSEGMLQRSTKAGYEVVSLEKAMRVPRPLCGLARTPARTLLVIGDGGLILRSTNDGASWKRSRSIRARISSASSSRGSGCS